VKYCLEKKISWVRWLKPEILAIWEARLEQITIEAIPGKPWQDTISTNEWLGTVSGVHPSSQLCGKHK
jgi:hypothetical protein